MSKNRVVCTACSQPKFELAARKSRLVPETILYLCKECIRLKREPRFTIILYARMNGIESVAEYLRGEDRYVGDPITAREIV